MVAISESLELPRPVQLLRSTGLNLTESFGLPLGGYALATWLWGRDAGVLAMLAAIWITAVIRKFATGSVPGLVVISMIVLTVQAIAAIATGSLWIFLVHFPVANFGLCLVFAYTARGHSPLAERLAAEVIGLRARSLRQPRLQRFFQHVTVLWAGIFLLLAACLGALLAEDPTVTYVPIWAAITAVLITAGIGVSTLWLRSVLRKLGIGLCFGPAATAPPAPLPPLAVTAGANRSPSPPDGSSGLGIVHAGRCGVSSRVSDIPRDIVRRGPAQYQEGQDQEGAVTRDLRRPGPAAALAGGHRRQYRGIRAAGSGAR